MVSVQLIKKHKTARLLPNGLAITTTASRKVTSPPRGPCSIFWGDEGLTSPAEAVGCLGSECGSSCWRPARANTAALLLFLNLTLFLAEANPKQNPAEPGKSLPGSSKTFKLLKPEEGMGFGPQYTA